MAVSKNKCNQHNEKKSIRGTTSASTKKTVSAQKEPLRIIGIGASAGGLEAFQQFFSHMPPDSSMAFVIVQHLDPSRHSSVPDILTRYTSMPIREATDGMKVEPDSVYLIPPNKSMGIKNGALYLQEPAQSPALKLPVDFFFRSLAMEKGSDAICIILSGTGTDGTLGLRAIKTELGTVFVQDPKSAKYDGMPRSAVDTGLADFVLSPEQMPQQLIKFVHHSAINGAKIDASAEEEKEPLQQIFSTMRARTGHDFSCYKQTTIRRRLERRMSVNQIGDIADYALLLRENEVEVKALLKDILISVTSFFRDPEAFDALKDSLKRQMEKKADGEVVRIWVPGCATGEEAYSVAIIVSECLDELEKHAPVQMYATDIGTDALFAARTGSYPTNIAADVTPERLRRFFIKESNAYRIRKELREMVVFAPQNFIKDPPFSRMDLICCRNLLIYLESDAQKMMFPLLHYALKPGGLLFLGPSETIGSATDLFSLLDRKWKIYQCREAVVHAERLKFPPAFAPAIQERWATDEPTKAMNEIRIPELAEKIFMDDYAPTFAVIDEKYRLVYVRGRTGKYLQIASGQPSLSILEMAREDLRTELASAVYRAISDRKKIVLEGVRVKYNSGFQVINLTVAPLSDYRMPPGLLIVVFQEVEEVTAKAKTRPAARSRKQVAELEEELKFSKENLQTTIEELEATNEELKSANEELQSNNEELQNANEELDTSREELQSLNTELTTVNAELQDKNEQLTRANDDLRNFLNRTDIAIIFLDSELKIRSFTPASTDVFNLRDIDVGRPLDDITSRLDHDNLADDAREVLRTLKAKEIEVQRKDSHWYNMRILPYLTTHNQISGLVMSFLDIDKQKKAADELAGANRRLEEALSDTEEAEERFRIMANSTPLIIWVTDADGRIQFINRAYSDFFGVNLREVQESGWQPLVHPEDSETYINEYITANREFIPFHAEARVRHADGTWRWVESQGQPRVSPSGEFLGIAGSSLDITERKKAQDAVREERDRLLALVNSTEDEIWFADIHGNFILQNDAARREFKMDHVSTVNIEKLAKGIEVYRPDGSRRPAEDTPALRALKGVTISNEEEIIRTPVRGELRHRQLNASPVRDVNGNIMGSVTVVRDITELKNMEERIHKLLEERSRELEYSQFNFALLVRTIAEGVIVVDNQGCILFGNPAAAAVLNIPEKELPGYHFGIPVSLGITEVEIPVGQRVKIIELDSVEVNWDGQQGHLATMRDITQQKRTAEIIRTLSQRLVEAQEKERREIGHELHDEVGGALTAVKIALGRAKKKLGEKSASELNRVDEILSETMDTVSMLSQNMRPDILSDFGLAEALKWHFERYTGQTGIKVHFRQKLDAEKYSATIEVTAYRIIQEALTNVVRYAGVKEVTVDVHSDSEKLYIRVEDHGRGFDPQQLEEGLSGITGMQDRAFLLGGELFVDSSPGRGTCVSFELPLRHG